MRKRIDNVARVDCSDLPVVRFRPLDCTKQQFKHLVGNPDKKIITLKSTVRQKDVEAEKAGLV